MTKTVNLKKLARGLEIISNKFEKAKVITDCGGVNIILERYCSDDVYTEELEYNSEITERQEEIFSMFSDSADELNQLGFSSFGGETENADFYIIGFYFEFESKKN